jgi:SET and MYND domain-containing protein
VTQGKSATRCLQNCSDEVIWCDATCRATDLARHVFECAWLKANSDVISRQEGDYNFRTLWHVVRLLAGRHLETVGGSGGASSKLPQQHPWERDWKSVELCCSHLDSWPEPQIGHWRRLAELYLSEPSLLPTLMGPDEMLALICKEESNTFGLYEKLTGPSSAPRGECFGMSLYPRAAMFNHSCAPNVGYTAEALHILSVD